MRQLIGLRLTKEWARYSEEIILLYAKAYLLYSVVSLPILHLKVKLAP